MKHYKSLFEKRKEALSEASLKGNLPKTVIGYFIAKRENAEKLANTNFSNYASSGRGGLFTINGEGLHFWLNEVKARDNLSAGSFGDALIQVEINTTNLINLIGSKQSSQAALALIMDTNWGTNVINGIVFKTSNDGAVAVVYNKKSIEFAEVIK